MTTSTVPDTTTAAVVDALASLVAQGRTAVGLPPDGPAALLSDGIAAVLEHNGVRAVCADAARCVIVEWLMLTVPRAARIRMVDVEVMPVTGDGGHVSWTELRSGGTGTDERSVELPDGLGEFARLFDAREYLNLIDTEDAFDYRGEWPRDWSR